MADLRKSYSSSRVTMTLNEEAAKKVVSRAQREARQLERARELGQVSRCVCGCNSEIPEFNEHGQRKRFAAGHWNSGALMIDAPEFKETPACRGEDPALFFPVPKDGRGRSEDGTPEPVATRIERARTRQAKEVCGRCPARVECLEFALEHREPVGIWGGMTPGERLQEIAARKGESA